MLVTGQRRHNQGVGEAGEERAVGFLRDKGYQIWERNYRKGQDEIDIVAFDVVRQEIVFVEVKTRANNFAGEPAAAVNSRKMAAQERAALKYLTWKKSLCDYRFDIIAVLPEKVEQFENVTWP